jgi:hypothetical protein
MAAAAVASAPSGSFAAILRRSNWASFDPAIQQVYTTHGGHAHRGDWGFKRPLPLKKRGVCVTVDAVDSPSQQTEWNPADRQAKWLKMATESKSSVHARDNTRSARSVDEIQFQDYRWRPDSDAVRPVTAEGGPIDPFTHTYDTAKARNSNNNVVGSGLPSVSSEDLPSYIRQSQSKGVGIAQHAPVRAAPLVESMSARRFAKYERELREKRPEFLRFLAAKKGPHASAYEDALEPINSVSSYLAETSAEEAMDTNVRNRRGIVAQPHPTGGFTYTLAPPMQAQLNSRALPGRYLGEGGNWLPRHASNNQQHNTNNRPNAHSEPRVGFAGQVMTIQRDALGSHEGPRANAPIPEGMFTVARTTITSPPVVVGRVQSTLHGVGVNVQLRSAEIDRERVNPHRPGSPAWMAHDELGADASARNNALFGGMGNFGGQQQLWQVPSASAASFGRQPAAFRFGRRTPAGRNNATMDQLLQKGPAENTEGRAHLLSGLASFLKKKDGVAVVPPTETPKA